jgi:hypothetical protein
MPGILLGGILASSRRSLEPALLLRSLAGQISEASACAATAFRSLKVGRAWPCTICMHAQFKDQLVAALQHVLAFSTNQRCSAYRAGGVQVLVLGNDD